MAVSDDDCPGWALRGTPNPPGSRRNLSPVCRHPLGGLLAGIAVHCRLDVDVGRMDIDPGSDKCRLGFLVCRYWPHSYRHRNDSGFGCRIGGVCRDSPWCQFRCRRASGCGHVNAPDRCLEDRRLDWPGSLGPSLCNCTMASWLSNSSTRQVGTPGVSNKPERMERGSKDG